MNAIMVVMIMTVTGFGQVDGSPMTADTNQNWRVSLSEVLRVIQFYNLGQGWYHPCPEEETEDGYCPGPPEITLGNYVGQPLGNGINCQTENPQGVWCQLLALQLSADIDYVYHSQIAQGRVVSLTPTEVYMGDQVIVVVSEGSAPVVPTTTGDTLAVATAKLTAVGIPVCSAPSGGWLTEVSDTVAAGLVLRTNPPAGITLAFPGDCVGFVLSAGPEAEGEGEGSADLSAVITLRTTVREFELYDNIPLHASVVGGKLPLEVTARDLGGTGGSFDQSGREFDFSISATSTGSGTIIVRIVDADDQTIVVHSPVITVVDPAQEGEGSQ